RAARRSDRSRPRAARRARPRERSRNAQSGRGEPLPHPPLGGGHPPPRQRPPERLHRPRTEEGLPHLLERGPPAPVGGGERRHRRAREREPLPPAPPLRGGARARQPSLLARQDRKSTRLNSSHVSISYAVLC